MLPLQTPRTLKRAAKYAPEFFRSAIEMPPPRILLKTYCYSDHELPFIIAQLQEGFDHIEKMYVYEFNYTHTGLPKPYTMEPVLKHIPAALAAKLVYKKVDLSGIAVYAYDDEPLIHTVNEPLMRSWFFNDPSVRLTDDTVILDVDVDEIVYKSSYSALLTELLRRRTPLSIQCNQFYFRHNWLWTDCRFASPSIYFFGWVRDRRRTVKGRTVYLTRDLPAKTTGIYAVHMSWIMPVSYMQKKLVSYSHPKYRIYNDRAILESAIREKKYIFNPATPFTIAELDLADPRIPRYLARDEIFEYLDDAVH